MSKKARNEFEVLMRTQGITKKRFGEITGARGTTVDKYLANPSLLRVKHLECLANAQEIDCTKNALLNKIK